MTSVDRRSFIRNTAGFASTALIPASMSGLLAACTQESPTGVLGPRLDALANARQGSGGYGDLVSDAGVLLLPEGFRVQTFGVMGEMMSDGVPTPLALDGMAAFRWHNRIRLIRNHEDRNPPGTVLLNPKAYDPLAGGGTTTLELEVDYGVGDGEVELEELRHPTIRVTKSFVSIAGTWVNCAGGLTPWGSWLTCEETVAGVSEGFSKPHGYVFDVPVSAETAVDPVPLKAMGRFSHEAIAVDPRTGIVYETEDNAFPPGSGFYQFVPSHPRDPSRGGVLQMARIAGSPKLEIWRGSEIGIMPGATFDVEWVDIPHVDPDPNDEMPIGDREMAVFQQGLEQGGAIFNRLEGCWYGDNSIYFHDTRGGRARRGHVWRYIPGPGLRDRGKLVLIFESPGVDVLDSPDNICVSPRGGLVLCEDGGGTQFMRGLTKDGQIFSLAQNTLNDNEFAGATFSPLGQILFANIQGATSGNAVVAGANPATRGLTMAITGPWRRGAL